MTLTAPQERRMALQPEADSEDAPSPRDIKYRQDAANYISAMLAELRQIAGKAGFEKLVASLDTAYYDAYAVNDARKPAQPNGAEKISPTTEPDSK